MDCVNVTVWHDNTQRIIAAYKNASLLDALRSGGFYVAAICGGNGVCGKCKIKLLEGKLDITGADSECLTEEEINEGYRLSCTAFPIEDIAISLASQDEESFFALTYFDSKPDGTEDGAGDDTFRQTSDRGKKQYSVGVDIGTTTIAICLVDLMDGVVIDSITAVNKQREYGADVVSRILSASNGKLEILRDTVRNQIDKCISDICDKNKIDEGQIEDVAIAANTTMLHMLLGLCCDTLGAYPFTPVTLDHIIKDYNQIFYGGIKGRVHILPGISTYVGADITAGIFFSGLYKANKPSVLLDIGTNGEMAVYKEGSIYCTATAAGPAFEGGCISCGTGGVPGAISSAKYENGRFEAVTIGGRPPVGICGSGVIDITYECLKNGLIDKTGRFKKEYGSKGVVVAKDTKGNDISFTQKDVRELQMGKSAIRSGIDVLLAHTGLTYEDVDILYIAGGFGFKINFESGAALGLIPSELKGKIKLIGNSSLGGAVKYLTENTSSMEFDKIISASHEHSLPHDKLFNKLFIENMSF